MKRFKISLLLLSAMLIGASCSDNKDDSTVDGIGNVTVSIKGQPTTRYVGTSTKNPEVENLVSNFTVLVFNYNTGVLEKSKSFNFAVDKLTGKLTDISTGTRKRIVALVNVPADVKVDEINTYSQLDNNLISLESQNNANLSTTGLFMSGESDGPVTLNAGDNAITIPVRRLVAKVVLKSLIFNSDPSAIPNYSLNKVSVQKARTTGTAFGDIVQPTGNANTNYAGGIASTAFDTTYGFLSENLELPAGYTPNTNIISTDTDQRYFYVLPNNGSGDNPTLLTLAAKYGNPVVDAYYPFIINGTNGQGSTDGTYITSNKIYAISVVISHPNSPSDDPNIIPSQGVLSVTITPLDWENTIEQQVEW